jgi:DNA-directed RNA polymerase specialized sigma24 family protein
MGGTGETRGNAFRIVRALNDEWEELVSRQTGAVARWRSRHSVLSGCLHLDDVLLAARQDGDSVLGALLSENRVGDELAGRTVLQAMLGKVVLLALRDRDAEVDDYVTAMWCRIRTYPLQTRPRRIAANLALDTLKAVKIERQWGTRAVSVATLPPGDQLDRLSTEAAVRQGTDHNAELACLTAGRVITAADQLGLIDGQTRAVLLSVYSDGLSGRDAARRHQTSPGMVRFRCSRAVRRLAQHASLLADAA